MAAESASENTALAELEWFDAVDRLLERAVNRIQPDDGSELSVLFPNLDSVLESNASFRLLVLQERLRDAYVLSRVIYETSLNACFILTDVKELSNRARTHAKQKALRNVVRSIQVAGDTVFKFELKGADEVLKHPEHQRLLDEFTTRSGREVSSWTPESVPQRLEAVYTKFGPLDCRGLAFGLLVYRHASEIAHGTLFGTLFSWGATNFGAPLSNASDISTFRQGELKNLIRLVAYSHESVVRILGGKLGDPDLAKEAVAARNAYYRGRSA